MNKIITQVKRLLTIIACILLFDHVLNAQGVKFRRDFSPAEGIVKPQEAPYREEICLNGKWDFQPVNIPKDWKSNTGNAPELMPPIEGKWERTKIKIPSPWNVNEWGGGSKVGKGTDRPYSPSSVYYPSYPQSWADVRMAWLRRSFQIPSSWNGKRIVLHFEAVMGDFVVFVNGEKTEEHFGDYMPVDIDITDVAKLGQVNELRVGIRHRKLFDKTSSQYKYFRSTYPPGSNTDNLVGIWQDVFLQALPPVRVTDVFVKPWVDKDELEFDVELENQTSKEQKLTVSGAVKEWVNRASKDVLGAPEIKWQLGANDLIAVNSGQVILKPGERKRIILKSKVQGRLKLWSPTEPNLYTILLQVNGKKQVLDCKSQRFGWRQFTIQGKDFYLNGKKIQCFADIQHPFGAYICSRRFAWAWFKMIKDFGGNTVRLHAQPWPEFYYELADEMGLMVLDEGALFGSSLSLNFGEEITWERTAQHIDALVMRDRNHPSVIGWSAGNELFAIRAYNKPTPDVAALWDEKIIKIAQRPAALDPTRQFITDDGDQDMNGHLAVWSKHFGHGLKLDLLPKDLNKPLIIGESGATYYGKPKDLYQFAGEKAYESYYGRSEALAIDVYQNAVKMAKPFLAYYSPSEVSWFGLEHMNLGYNDYSRLPDSNDGIFFGPYIEGKPGYQVERIPPYVTTFNPGLDPSLPVYKPLPMFEALQAALSKAEPQPCPWDNYQMQTITKRTDFPSVVFQQAYFVGKQESVLAKQLGKFGISLTMESKTAKCIIIDGENLSEDMLKKASKSISRVQNEGGLIWVMISDGKPSAALNALIPASFELTNRQSTSLQSNKNDQIGKYFNLPDLYFSEMDGDRNILKQGLTGDLVKKGSIVFEATNIDWSLFNQTGENRKCAQVVLYEHLKKPQGVAMVTYPVKKSTFALSVIDYKITSKETVTFWKNLYAAMGLKSEGSEEERSTTKKNHDLLLDGPLTK
ncbi:MAG: glycoside hydrolase family 2 TIM barrel-domain containing protein [Bacteroidota bacterium]|nr:glycoside hydrolase family 2 TIM barrel-domain containing protein [Bacteroidota bacterium]